MKTERWLISILILLVAAAMTLFSPHTIYRTFPLIFGIISLTSYVMKKIFVFDIGIFLTIISYLFASSEVPPTVYNLLVIMLFFFVLIGIWFYGRNTLLISGIESRVSGDSDIGLSEFRRASLTEILNTLLMGVLLSILASFIVLSSSIGMDIGPRLETFLMVGLSAAVFFITFFIIRLLSSQNIRTREES